MAQLVIKGHTIRGNEVIEILEMLGGRNPHNYIANCDSLCFSIGKGTNIIYYDWVKDCYEDEDILVFSLEEFLEKYPYKVGDKVLYKTYGIYSTIKTMKWNSEKEQVFYRLDSKNLFVATVDELKPYKEETMEEIDEKAVNHVFETEVISFDIAQRDKYELDLQGKFEVVLREGKYYVERIKPKYPEAFEECAKILDCFCAANIDGYKHELLENLQELITCRDAYWKIAGDWKFDFDESCYYLCNEYGSVQKFEGRIDCNAILTFPTKEMRDAFYENFKELIEECKEFL